jgi:hypothetical protein
VNSKHWAGLGLVLIAHGAGAVPATTAFPQTGLVRDAVTQQPLAGVLILPWKTFDEDREEPVVEPLAEVRTDSTGSYTLTLRSATNVLFWKPGYVFAVFDWAGDLVVERDCCGNCKIREVFLRPNNTPATATVEQVVTKIRDHRRRIPGADAATRLERLFYLPSHIHVQNQSGWPAMIVADPESLQTLHLQVGKDMAVGRTSELVYYDGAERIRIARAGPWGGPVEAPVLPMVVPPELADVVARRGSIRVAWEFVVFETDIQLQRLWVPPSENYRELWRGAVATELTSTK